MALWDDMSHPKECEVLLLAQRLYSRRMVAKISPRIPIAITAITPGSGACVGFAVAVSCALSVPVGVSIAVVLVSTGPVGVSVGAGTNVMLLCWIRPSCLLNAKYRPYLPLSVCAH